MIAALLPWYDFADESIRGIGGGDAGARAGVVTLLIAAVLAVSSVAAALIRRPGSFHLTWAGIAIAAGALVVLIAAYEMTHLSDVTGGNDVPQSGPGLWITLIGGLVIVALATVGAIVRLASRP